MDRDIEDRLERALSGYRRKRELFLDAQKKLRAAPVTSTSRDRLLTVTVDTHGDLTALTFNSTGYALMEKADLAELIMTTMAEARAKARGQARQAAEPQQPMAAGSGEAASGDAPWMRILPREALSRPVVSIQSGRSAGRPVPAGAAEPGQSRTSGHAGRPDGR